MSDFPEPRPKLWTLDFVALTVVLGIGVLALGMRELAGFLLFSRWYLAESIPAVLLVELGGMMAMSQYVESERRSWLALAAVIAAFAISALLNFQAVAASGADGVMFPGLTMFVVSVGLSILEYMLAYVWSVRYVGHEAAVKGWHIRRAEWQNAEAERKRQERREARRERAEAKRQAAEAKVESLPTTERRAAIAATLAEAPNTTTAELAERFGVSERTIRNDRKELE